MFDEENNFYLDGNDEFSSRQKSVFEALDKMSSEKPPNRYINKDLKDSKFAVIKGSKCLKQFIKQESIFKRPEVPLKKCMKMKMPDFLKNPHKWKKYSLGDDEITDQSNQIVAMNFLNSLKKKSDKNEDMEVNNCVGYIKYIKERDDVQNLAVQNDPSDKATFINGKTIMSEYVVGQKVKKVIKKKLTVSFNPCVKLNHLFDED